MARRALAEAREEKGALREQLRELREKEDALQRSKEELEVQVRQQQEVRGRVGAPHAGGGWGVPKFAVLCPHAAPFAHSMKRILLPCGTLHPLVPPTEHPIAPHSPLPPSAPLPAHYYCHAVLCTLSQSL